MKTLICLILVFLIVGKIHSQARYYKAQMHCHSTNSDGNYTPQELVEKYKNSGYEIIMITDHNYLTLSSEVNVPGVLIIQSEEITFDRHWNGFFLNDQIIPTENYTCQEAIDAVRLQGGLIQLNHYRKGLFSPASWAANSADILAFENGPDFLEIWNTGTELTQTNDDKSVWDSVLTAGKIVWGSATDDFHPSTIEYLEYNKEWNMIWLDSLCPLNVYNSLKEGKFYASTGVEISRYEVTDGGTYKEIYIESPNAQKIAFCGPNHQKLIEFNSNTATFILSNHDYVRAELIKSGFLGTNTQYAWTQPVFLHQQSTTELAENYIKGLSIYPNPAQNIIFIKNSNSNNKINSISVFNNSGICLYKNRNIINDIHLISTENWASGVYTFLIEFENKNILRKNISVIN
ncbi:MAG TPA: CehA/McbA family metallohydrolase [Bacteroidales bacterium]|jgi:hypothetical protein|nr:CehA/McbA family metallohydrolase [Bacteroidales bacterium]HOL96985.1 CehA/McbA family metallohydrolase [Bacteroidales bacterium]HOM36298.1 CehA/McbA family metallohydrolase [Bacteroidales bacterium]HPD23778.1 CehA/McbA family metallohydrolase [Bacteroidales bacterium]HRS98670.1 CehA/McbA family metallohydrolase [Bacteroidales bacterium]